ncbi:hypothetical protein [Methanonatronarchaeum sp. AMET6-2]|uniref:hypothetical protein n=1 Tax=Methanonatronarchaeum sp. AMET6-2 TaxID=2933293 RepID=UPI001FF39C0B|nr:hypothetical protein [Methanonatronarchaeum sp. AMET6-2]UOY10026.1 hypothetical protein MU439_07150 [Methanonatronarchaeum sp. AMET6-2]
MTDKKQGSQKEEDEQNYRPPDLKEEGLTNETCFRCQSEGIKVLKAGDKEAVIYLCPECEHMWGVNHNKEKIEEIPKELPHYQEVAKKLREQYQDIL